MKTLLTAGRIDKARSIFVGDVLKTYAEAKAVLQGAVEDMEKDVRSEGASTTQIASAATTLNSISLGLALAIGTGAAVFGNLHLARPLARKKAVMRRLSDGETEIAFPARGRKDESAPWRMRSRFSVKVRSRTSGRKRKGKNFARAGIAGADRRPAGSRSGRPGKAPCLNLRLGRWSATPCRGRPGIPDQRNLRAGLRAGAP